MAFTRLKYKIFGRAIKARNKARAFRKSIKDDDYMHDEAKDISVLDVMIQEEGVRMKIQQLTQGAKDLVHANQGLGEFDRDRLRDIFLDIEHYHQVLAGSRSTKAALLSVGVARDTEKATRILENHVLNEANKQFIKRAIRPSTKSVYRKAHLLSQDKDSEQTFREEVTSMMKEDEEGEVVKQEDNDQKFEMWLSTLKCDTHEKKGTSDLERRIAEMKNRII
jgi:hypothetical protein